MTKEKLKSIFQRYQEHLRATTTISAYQMNVGQTQVLRNRISHLVEVSHLLWMCQEAQKFVDEGRVEKAMRWLGFLQGVFWAKTEFTLDELKNHSRPDEAK